MNSKARIYKQKPKDFSPQVEVAACYCECEGRYLWLHRSDDRPQGGTWGVPAGKLEKGETPQEGVIREVFEETQIELCPETLKDLGPLFVRYPDLDFVYHVFHQKFSSFPLVQLSKEHKDFHFFRPDEMEQRPLILGALETLEHFLVLAYRTQAKRRA